MAWEENAKAETASTEKSSHHGMAINHKKEAPSAKIFMKILQDGKEQKKIDITDGSKADNHAVITEVNKGVVIAWVTEGKSSSGIRYSFVKIE